jgi:NADPH:quinone reductase-like Zn-dependent oxidoreductase
MRAVVHDRYGPPDVLRLGDVERPVPKEDEVLVKIHASTVNRSDCGLRSAEYFITRFFTGLLRPKRKIVGSELAGEVEAVGAAVTEFAVGDRVFGMRAGANADFVCVRESGALAHMPAGMTFDEAAAVCDGAVVALGFLRRADLRKGKKILVYGASGSIGTASVQLARYFDAQAGRYRAIIDRTYPLEDVVEATRYVETGQKTGNVVLTLNGAVRERRRTSTAGPRPSAGA